MRDVANLGRNDSVVISPGRETEPLAGGPISLILETPPMCDVANCGNNDSVAIPPGQKTGPMGVKRPHLFGTLRRCETSLNFGVMTLSQFHLVG